MSNVVLINLPTPSQRRRHSQAFKDQVIAACMLPGVSIASVALANQLNANYLRKWLKDYKDHQSNASQATLIPSNAPPQAFIPVKVAPSSHQVNSQKNTHNVSTPSPSIHISIQRQDVAYEIQWPSSDADACGRWLQSILRWFRRIKYAWRWRLSTCG